jgi:hypothetical protein
MRPWLPYRPWYQWFVDARDLARATGRLDRLGALWLAAWCGSTERYRVLADARPLEGDVAEIGQFSARQVAEVLLVSGRPRMSHRFRELLLTAPAVAD